MNKENNKVGMVTMYSDNYGSCLQAFALYNRIQYLGYDPTIIKYVPYDLGKNGKEFSKMYKLTHLPINTILHLFLNYRMIHGHKKAYEKFRESKLSFTKKSYGTNINEEGIKDSFNAFVCGSDMMWCETFSDDWEHYFLRFTSKEKRISYAPSFGVNKISTQNIDRCRRYLEGFNSNCLSCRDISGVRMIKDRPDTTS